MMMLEESGIALSSWVMLITMILGFLATLWIVYWQRKKFGRFNWTTAAWLLPTLYLIIFYAILALQIEPIASNPYLRVALFRPGFWFLFVFVVMDKLNGQVIIFIDSINEGVKCFLASMRHKL